MTQNIKRFSKIHEKYNSFGLTKFPIDLPVLYRTSNDVEHSNRMRHTAMNKYYKFNIQKHILIYSNIKPFVEQQRRIHEALIYQITKNIFCFGYYMRQNILEFLEPNHETFNYNDFDTHLQNQTLIMHKRGFFELNKYKILALMMLRMEPIDNHEDANNFIREMGSVNYGVYRNPQDNKSLWIRDFMREKIYSIIQKYQFEKPNNCVMILNAYM